MYLKKGHEMKLGPFLFNKGGPGIGQADAVIHVVRYLISPRAQLNGL